jgi:outer membrane protein OmpA-like peptidoglycan-associated protein
MRLKAVAVLAVALATLTGGACATKKHVRNRINERVTPLENRTGELEETSRRNTQDVGRLRRDIEDVRLSTDRAQQQADRAASAAEQANVRVSGVEQSVTDLRNNLDRYTVQKVVTVLFAVGKSELTMEAQASLDEIASQIRDRSGFLLEIQGFASSDGATDFNDRLSQARSESVRRYMAERHNIPLFRMSILGFGESRPVADNESRDGRVQNRRVEVRLLTNNAVSQQSN